MNRASLKTRREFLRSSLLGGALTWTVPSFVGSTINALFAREAGAAVTGLTGQGRPHPGHPATGRRQRWTQHPGPLRQRLLPACPATPRPTRRCGPAHQ
jgi:hypothetical protein